MISSCGENVELSSHFNRLNILLLVFLLLLSNAVFSKTLKIAAVPFKPPYVFPKTESGIELDIVKESLRVGGYVVEFTYFPYKRRLAQIKNGKLDGVMTVAENSGLQVYFSDPYVQYQNVVISLKNRSFIINEIKASQVSIT